jgi:hypothetical protein
MSRAVVSYLQKRRWSPVVVPVYAAVVALFVVMFAQFYLPGQGFSYLIDFGGKNEASRIAAMKGLHYYVHADSDGYDAQYYAQIAMHPSLRNPELPSAIDSLPYRARRIFFAATAHALGLGRPAWILQAYAVQNAVCWLVLAVVLLHWFPPTDWDRFARWVGVLFSFGMCVSLRNALIDGPSLLLIALGVMCVERGRPWLAAFILGAGGLAKETNVLGAAALLRREERPWRWRLWQGLLVVAPLGLWLVYLQWTVGPATDLGVRNFGWPLAAYARKWASVLPELFRAETWRDGVANAGAFWSLLMLVALTVQLLFLVLRPRPKEAMWRVGLSFAVLMVVLGDAVWEGYPGAASRVLLPLQLAFNVLVPCGRRWWVVLLLGNATLFNAPAALEPPAIEGCELSGPGSVLTAVDGGRVRVEFGAAWYGTEHLHRRYWRWSSGDADVCIVNPQRFPIAATLTFTLSSTDARNLRLAQAGGPELWRGPIANTSTAVTLSAITLGPGENRFLFTSDRPPVQLASGDPRPLAFCLKNLTIELRPAPMP